MNEAFAEFAETVWIDGIGNKQAAWQETARGKSLGQDAGFALDSGGSLIIQLKDLTPQELASLDGRKVRRIADNVTRRIRGVNTTRLVARCTLQPTTA